MKLSDFLTDVGRPVAFYPSLVKAFGDRNEAIFISQMAYWRGKERDPDGWIFKSSAEIEEETSLTYKEQINVRKGLVAKNLLEERYARTEHKMYFRVNWEGVNQRWEKYLEERHLTDGQLTNGQVAVDQRSGGSLPEVSSLIGNTYITQEITPPVADAPGLPLDWKIAADEAISEEDLREEKRKQMVTTANLIATGMGSQADAAREIALAFMEEMDFVFSDANVKRERKFIRDLLSEGVKVNRWHIRKAIQKMRDEGLTIPPRISSVSAVALALAVEPEKPESEHEEVPESVLEARRRLEKSNEYN